MKKKYLFFALILFVISCSKSGSSASDSSTSGTTGTGSTTTTPVTPTPSPAQNVWQLSGITLAGVPQTITSMQASFQMSFYADGRYLDTDGAAGTWRKPTSDSIVIAKTNLPTHITSRYKIRGQSTSTLLLRTGINASQIDLTYAAK
jgi:hypothetical protein